MADTNRPGVAGSAAMRVVVIGAGVGGLCAAIRLRTAGHDVTVFERNPVVGGKLASLSEDGYTFDLGPTLFTMPHLYDDVFRLAGSSLAGQVEMTRLDPQFRYRWSDGSSLDVPDDRRHTLDRVEAFAPDDGDNWMDLEYHAQQIWEVAERTFLAGTVDSAWTLVKRSKNPLDLDRVEGKRTLAQFARSSLDDPRLRQLIGRYATYSGSSPYEAPATLACILHIEQEYGCWHLHGGVAVLADRLRDHRPSARCRVPARDRRRTGHDRSRQGHGRRPRRRRARAGRRGRERCRRRAPVHRPSSRRDAASGSPRSGGR
ncbi:MAG: FAD-dependent oxidoreductase [Ilumatobacteraceae bacterium]